MSLGLQAADSQLQETEHPLGKSEKASPFISNHTLLLQEAETYRSRLSCIIRCSRCSRCYTVCTAKKKKNTSKDESSCPLAATATPLCTLQVSQKREKGTLFSVKESPSQQKGPHFQKSDPIFSQKDPNFKKTDPLFPRKGPLFFQITRHYPMAGKTETESLILQALRRRYYTDCGVKRVKAYYYSKVAKVPKYLACQAQQVQKNNLVP